MHQFRIFYCQILYYLIHTENENDGSYGERDLVLGCLINCDGFKNDVTFRTLFNILETDFKLHLKGNMIWGRRFIRSVSRYHIQFLLHH